MKFGVKFCGGCNPHYQRGDAFRKIKADMPHIDFEHAEEGVEYDILLVIGGCSACCPLIDRYTVKDEVIKMWSENQIEDIESKLEKKLQEY